MSFAFPLLLRSIRLTKFHRFLGYFHLKRYSNCCLSLIVIYLNFSFLQILRMVFPPSTSHFSSWLASSTCGWCLWFPGSHNLLEYRPLGSLPLDLGFILVVQLVLATSLHLFVLPNLMKTRHFQFVPPTALLWRSLTRNCLTKNWSQFFRLCPAHQTDSTMSLLT